MKFLILSDTFSLEDWLINDGEPHIAPAVYELFNYLGSHPDHRFDAIVFNKNQNATKTFRNGSKIRTILHKAPQHYYWKWGTMKRMYKEAISQTERTKYDVVYGLSIYSNVARRIGEECNLVSVGRIFGSLFWNYWERKNYIKLFTRYFYQYQEARWGCDLLVCTEDGTEFDEAVNRFNPKQKLCMMLNGINTDLRSQLLRIPVMENLTKETIRIASIGRLTFWKRHDLAIRLIKILKDAGVMAELTILGKGEKEMKLRRYADSMGVATQVSFIKPVPHRQIPDFYKNQDICVFLYDFSNLSNSMWEACLSGRLIVTRPTGKTSLYFKNKINCLINNDVEVLAKEIIELRQGKKLNTLNNASRDMVKKMIPKWHDRYEAEIKMIRNVLEQSINKNGIDG